MSHEEIEQIKARLEVVEFAKSVTDCDLAGLEERIRELEELQIRPQPSKKRRGGE